ncbi:MAG TPA: histidine kinase [Nocardioidaceae bacterium]|nr:histidine kinase [Nocardioidaceae bacterium]
MSGPRTGRVVGALVPAALVTAAAGEAVWRGWGRPGWMAVGLLGSAAVAVLALRRTHPLLAMTCFVAAAVAGTLVQATLPAPTARTTGAFVPIIALLVLSYSLSAHGDRRAVLLGGPQPVALVGLVDLFQPQAGSTVTGMLFAAVILVGAPVLAGWLVSSRGRLLADLRRTEAIRVRQHAERLRSIRAQESLRVWERLSDDLAAGLDVIARTASSGGPGAAEVVETTARALLAQTRTTVVELTPARGGPVSPDEQAEPAQPAGTVRAHHAQPWTVLVASAAGLATVLPTHLHWSAPLLALFLCGLLVAALAAMWRFPLAGATVAWVAVIGYDRLVADVGSDRTLTVPLVVVATPFLVGWLERRVLALAGLAVCLAGGLACAQAGDLLGVVVLALLAWGGGLALRSRVLLLDRVRRAHEQLDRERVKELDAVVLEERAALARDVHDAVGHSLTVLALQAGAARRLGGTDEAACASALATVGEVAREAAAQLAGGTLRSGDLDALLAGARRAGVQLTVSGAAALLGTDDVIGATVHRIVQESLTNAMRYAPGAHVDVVLARPRTDRLEVRVGNGPARGRPRLDGSGTGLAALAERVAALGGSLSAATTLEGGFVVVAELPVSARAPHGSQPEPVR